MTVEHDVQVRGAYLDRAVADQFRRVLIEQRDSLLERLSEQGDGVLAAADQSESGASLARAAEILEDVEAALHRLLAGTYGTCESCAEAIPVERLEIVPAAARCVRCQSRSSSLLG
jgi:DnaK suppressor protein